MRSYPRWIYEFKRCNVALHMAECCSIKRGGVDFPCDPCTDITLPMPKPFGPVVVPNEPKPKPQPKPEPQPKKCDPIPDVSMFSVYRPMEMRVPATPLIHEQFQNWCLDMTRTSDYEATLNIKMVGNAKLEPNYYLRLNQDDCTTIELRAPDEKEFKGQLVPYGEPFRGLDAYYFSTVKAPMPELYDANVGHCVCDNETGVCEGFYSEEVQKTLIK